MKTLKWICYGLTALCAAGILVCVARPATQVNQVASRILMLLCVLSLTVVLLAGYFALPKDRRTTEFWRLGAAIGLGVMTAMQAVRLL